jgi:hypothetical protein
VLVIHSNAGRRGRGLGGGYTTSERGVSIIKSRAPTSDMLQLQTSNDFSCQDSSCIPVDRVVGGGGDVETWLLLSFILLVIIFFNHN